MKIWEDERQCYIRAAMEKNSDAENEALKAQLDAIDWSVLEQIERKETVNERGVFAPLEAVEVEEIARRKDEFLELGIKALQEGKVGAVLLAGGQGTRLGLDRPKGTLNIGIHRELFLFQQLIRNLMDVTDEAGAYVPLYIMTSNINHDDTQAFFEEHGYFGYPKEYVKFFVQEMEPACDYQGRVYMESSTRVAMSPNGNGGWFGSMVNAGLLSDIRSHGIECWMTSTQEDLNGSMYLRWITACRESQTRCSSVRRLPTVARAARRLSERQRRMKRWGYSVPRTASRRSRSITR